MTNETLAKAKDKWWIFDDDHLT